MDSSYERRAWPLWGALCVVLVLVLYLTGLTSMGMYSTDEPRYADIGRAMARSGDWITPRLWGQPWFEKPAFLYWMTAAGFKVGLGVDLAPRLPVALLSLAFLTGFRWRLARVFDDVVANCSTAILATAAGWIAYSHVAVTDLPMSALFTMAVLFALPARNGEPSRVMAAIFLGLAVLAKSGPPIVLFLPVLIFDWKNWRRWFLGWPIAVFLIVALPWHVLAVERNGSGFLYVLFVEQQFGRFLNNSRQHQQPFWFYVPFFLLLLFPWFPLLAAGRRELIKDGRTQRLAAVVVTGLLFFSASVNKLPGYILPLIPSTCILIAWSLVRAGRVSKWLIAPIALLGMLPLLAAVLPELLSDGFRAARIPWWYGLGGIAAAALVGIAIVGGLRPIGLQPIVLLISSLTAACFLWLANGVFPLLDRAASGRPVWLAIHPTCAPVLPRGKLYGVYYYSENLLPDCGIVDKNADSTTPLRGGEPTK